VLIGYLAARMALFDEPSVRGLSLFAFNFAIPVLLLRTVAQTDMPPHPEWAFVFTYFSGAFTIFAVGAMIARYFGVGVMGLAFGLLFAGHSIGGALGAFAGGAIFDAFARYDWAWILALGLALLAAVFALMIQERRAPSVLAPAPA